VAYVYRKKPPQGKTLPHYYCAFRLPSNDGSSKQLHRSTRCRTKKEAQDAARLLEREALDEAGAGSESSQAILAKVREAAELALKGQLNPAHARWSSSPNQASRRWNWSKIVWMILPSHPPTSEIREGLQPADVDFAS
jgi:hypothetical protein